MKNLYVYVVAYHTLGGDPTMVSFLTTQISATDGDAVYDLGFKWLETQPMFDSITLVNTCVHQITN